MNILKSFLRFLTWPIILVVLLVVAVATSAYSYNLYQNAQKEVKKLKEDPRAAATEETKRLVVRVGKLVALPEGEEPTVATITDKERLKDQPFFGKAENGDRVLIYTQAKRAYLYSVKLDKVLEIAPINIGTGEATPTPSPTPRRR